MGGGSLNQISKMLDDHYAGKINVNDYWAVGDSRTEKISSISAGTTKESQPEQYVELVIIDFNHDILETEIQAKSYSAITVMVKNCLKTMGIVWDATNENTIKWIDSPRRKWCNNEFPNALNETLRGLIKPVSKKTSLAAKRDIYDIQTTTVDKSFILSLTEVTGGNASNAHSYYDGTQYEFMKTSSNRIKYIGTTPQPWWLRTGNQRTSDNYEYIFYRIDSTGTLDNGYTTGMLRDDMGIAPAFCL